MNKKRCRAFLLVLVILLTSLPVLTAKAAGQESSAEAELIMSIVDFINDNFAGEVDNVKLIQGAIRGMVESLGDPYSEYLTPEELKEFQTEAKGSFGGIGIVITSRDNFATVVSVIDDSPAARAGMMPGDRIVEIDGKDVKNLSTSEIASLLRGAVGTKVSVGVQREGKILKFVMTREIITINPVVFSILEKDIGYIKISEFNENTAVNVKKALDFFEKNNVRGIILDLRNNPGGILQQAVKVAEYFVPKGPIVKVVFKNGRTIVYNSESGPLPFKLVVLVNGGSASASEIVAGAIKDRKSGILIGEKTFGKATVQQIVDLGPFGGIKITVGRYVTPGGVDINKSGISPDIEVKQAMGVGGGQHDLQLERALEILRKLMSRKMDNAA
ncbi:Carboxy-terminal processing protease CtpB [Fervidicola ferrireducens]|uniref:Carboxy-terminal processing protease CtpB n=1 Tax=Fervidicola ferrireducens TaxID=520764 RepID=A0A140LDW7_9FIRM|nr:S41 family peptidase [Fervidicola ferrireducens]KXG78742.1 Carboxy-terminal processing protease CtpB [Fervidicola ferrireducens]